MSSDSEQQMDALALVAQQAAEEHLEACYEHILDNAPPPHGMEEPFCGCLTCQVRETLRAAWPHLRAMWEAE